MSNLNPLTFRAITNGKSSDRTHELSEIEDCAIAVDATYYIQYFLDSSPSHEPLLPALGGLTGFQSHIESDIDQWLANKVTPLFVFDGQTMIGQDEVSLVRGLRANERTNQAWELYRTGQAESAVSAFGANSGECLPPRCIDSANLY